MAKVVGDIAVQVGADVSGLQDGMRKGSKAVKGFENNSAEMGKKFAKISVGIGLAAAAITGAITKMAVDASKTAKEIQNLSNVSGIGVEAFQRLAVGGRAVGIEQEKLADIFKDVNDKFGDFMATGAGPLADFFENIAPAVGVTADQFARLSGPEALQLYVSSLEKAGVSQQQMTFYMEALASDATALVPLLANNGKEMRKLGDEAQRSGRILGKDAVNAGTKLAATFSNAGDILRTKFQSEILNSAGAIDDLVTDNLPGFIEGLDNVATAASIVARELGDVVGGIGNMITAIGEFGASFETFWDGIVSKVQASGLTLPQLLNTDLSSLGGDVTGSGGLIFQDLEKIPRAAPMEAGETSTTLFRAGVNRTAPPAVIPGTTPVIKPIKPGRGGGGGRSGCGGGGGNGRADFEALKQRFADEADLVQEQQEAALEKLREFREQKIATEEEYNALEADIKAEHAEKLAQIETAAQQARLDAFSGALGDLSSLMQSENKKLFKIGQAAAIADAVVKGFHAATTAWDKGMDIGGPPVAAAFSTASLLKTGTLIDSIKSASATGATSGGTGGAAGGVGQIAGPSPMQVQLDGVSDDNWYSGRNINDMLDNLSDAAGDRGMIIMRPG